ncbi:MAG TPA: hypothetical protein VL096_17955 [Pirellulaceae bacterium]|nr:hypothetical protein [Pirellulaceae bacterium]
MSKYVTIALLFACLFTTGCGGTTAEAPKKDEAAIEARRKNYEEMAKQERASK